jgi:class 3 adenylate cyclase
VVKTTGDGLMIAFTGADAAIQAGSAMHASNTARRAAGDATPGIHIGCHFGPVIESAGDLFGAPVNVAARVAGLARVGQIITTEDTISQLSPILRHRGRGSPRLAPPCAHRAPSRQVPARRPQLERHVRARRR